MHLVRDLSSVTRCNHTPRNIEEDPLITFLERDKAIPCWVAMIKIRWNDLLSMGVNDAPFATGPKKRNPVDKCLDLIQFTGRNEPS